MSSGVRSLKEKHSASRSETDLCSVPRAETTVLQGMVSSSEAFWKLNKATLC